MVKTRDKTLSSVSCYSLQKLLDFRGVKDFRGLVLELLFFFLRVRTEAQMGKEKFRTYLGTCSAPKKIQGSKWVSSGGT